MTRSIFIKIALIVFIFIVGPCACSNPCKDVPDHFIVQSIKADNFYYPSGKTSATQFVNTGTEVQWDDYILYVPFDVLYTASVGGSGAALYATSCSDPGYRGANTGVKEIKLIAVNDYNDNFHEGDNLNSIVSVAGDVNIFKSIDEFSSYNASTLFDQTLHIRFLEAPSQATGSYQFKIELHLLNGDVFTATNTPVTLLK